MPALLAFVPAWAWRWIAIAAVAIAAGGFCWIKGNEHGTQKLLDYQAKQAVENIRIAAAREKIVTVTEIEYRDRIKVIYQKGATITKEIPVYVTKADDAGCTVPIGFVREYNAAWAGAPAGSPAESDRGASSVPLSSVAEAVAEAATTCLAYKAQRDGLIQFYRAQQKVK